MLKLALCGAVNEDPVIVVTAMLLSLMEQPRIVSHLDETDLAVEEGPFETTVVVPHIDPVWVWHDLSGRSGYVTSPPGPTVILGHGGSVPFGINVPSILNHGGGPLRELDGLTDFRIVT